VIQVLTLDDVLALLKKTPEQGAFDWKTDFVVPNDDEKRGEFLKDLAATANSAWNSPAFIFYGVDPRRPDPVVGITIRYDDASLQQLARGKIEPTPEFLYYELTLGPRVVGVVQVQPTRRRPHIIAVDMGKVRRGQILVRRGSSTDGATIGDLLEFFYGQTSDHFPGFLKRMQMHTQQQAALTAYLQELRAQSNDALRDLEISVGAPPGSLGSK